MDFYKLDDAFIDFGVTVTVAEDQHGQFCGYRATSEKPGVTWDDEYSLEELFRAIIAIWEKEPTS